MDSANTKPRRNIACNECKRRKIRCSAEVLCSNCARDGKSCVYSTPQHRIITLQRSVQHYKTLLASVARAWAVHVPHISLEQALSQAGRMPSIEDPRSAPVAAGSQPPSTPDRRPETRADIGSVSDVSTPDQTNAEDYEFDESEDFQESIDGMAFLTAGAGKAGYTGPQSGIAAMKLLQSLPAAQSFVDIGVASPPTILSHQSNALSAGPLNQTHIDSYFTYYHPAYPLLHEGLFRARLAGAVAKPGDGSWPLLLNIVVAMGAFAGDVSESRSDWNFYQVARSSISLDVIEKGSLCYVQGLTIMANYLQKRNKPNAGFALIGIAWSMALAIGLHREFSTDSTTPFIMEQRRRTWWTLFTFVSGTQLTLGRPPASLVGINLRPPANVDDANITVELSEAPRPQEGPTVATCIIAQIKLAQIANAVQAELLTNQVPAVQRADELRHQIASWRADLPSCFEEQLSFELWFELPKAVLLWRAFHLRIVLDRPFLFRAIAQKLDLVDCGGPVWECLNAADACTTSICKFLERCSEWKRGFAWYATYWLITASFVHAICFAYTMPCPSREQWRAKLQQAVKALSSLGSAHAMANRAQQVLEKLLVSESGATMDLVAGFNNEDWAQTLMADTSLMDFASDSIGYASSQSLYRADLDSESFRAHGDSGASLHASAEFQDAASSIATRNYPEG